MGNRGEGGRSRKIRWTGAHVQRILDEARMTVRSGVEKKRKRGRVITLDLESVSTTETQGGHERGMGGCTRGKRGRGKWDLKANLEKHA